MTFDEAVTQGFRQYRRVNGTHPLMLRIHPDNLVNLEHAGLTSTIPTGTYYRGLKIITALYLTTNQAEMRGR